MPLLSPALPLRSAAISAPAAVDNAGPLDLRALLGEQAWFRLPAPVRHRFEAGHPDTVYEGRMMKLECSRVGRCFAALSRIVGAPLTAMRAESVPAVVRVSNDGRGGVIWERRFQATGCDAALVRSTKELGPDGLLFERTDGGLGMALAVFEQDGALVFESRRYELVLGRRIPHARHLPSHPHRPRRRVLPLHADDGPPSVGTHLPPDRRLRRSTRMRRPSRREPQSIFEPGVIRCLSLCSSS